MIFGIDISAWQTNVDYSRAVKEGGVKFAVLRAGYGRKLNQKDKQFEAHYNGFSTLGVPVGAYQYSYASDVAGAKAEAAAMIEWLKGKKLALPVFYDLEDAAVAKAGKSVITEMALAWCAALEAAGYKAGVYANRSWYNDYIDISKVAAKYAIWCAQWNSKQPDLPGLALWQFGGETNYLRSTAVPGINGPCDQNYLIKETLLKSVSEDLKASSEEIKTSSNKVSNKISGNIDTVKEVQIWLNNAFSSGLMPDGLYGTHTQVALVKALQKALNVAADGIYGPITNKAVKVLRKGDKGTLVKILQAFLVCYGYKEAYVDGDFWKGTEEALLKYQKRFGLKYVDGIAGQETFGSLCK